MTRSRSETAPPAVMHVMHDNDGRKVHSPEPLPGNGIRFLKDCTNDLKRCIDAGAVKANLTGLSKSDVGVLFSKLAAEAEKLQSVHFLVQPATKSKGGKDQVKKRREVDYKSEEYATALRDLALRTSGGKVEKVFKSSVVALFREATAISELTVGMPLPKQLFAALTQAVVSIQHLQSLSLRGSRLTDAKCAHLCVALSDCRSLKTLDLTGCALTDISATVVASLMKQRANNYCMERFKRLLRCYPDATMTAQLRHTLLCQDVRAIRDDLLRSCPGLKHINLSQNELTDSGAEDLFAAAAMEVGLLSLELRSNNLTIKGGRSARTTMLEHPCLEVIDMRLNTTPKLRLLRRSHVHRQSGNGSAPYDELTACLRMCGVSTKEAQAIQSGTGDLPVKSYVPDSGTSTLKHKNSPSMNSTMAGSLKIQSAQQQCGALHGSQALASTGRLYSTHLPPVDSPDGDGDMLTVSPASVMCSRPLPPTTVQHSASSEALPKASSSAGRHISVTMKQQAGRLTRPRVQSSGKVSSFKKRTIKKNADKQELRASKKQLSQSQAAQGRGRSVHPRSSGKGRRSSDSQARLSNSNLTQQGRDSAHEATARSVQTLLQMPHEETLFVEHQEAICDQHRLSGPHNCHIVDQSTAGMVQGPSSNGSNSFSGTIEPIKGANAQEDVDVWPSAAGSDELSPHENPDPNSFPDDEDKSSATVDPAAVLPGNEDSSPADVADLEQALASLLEEPSIVEDESNLRRMGNSAAIFSPAGDSEPDKASECSDSAAQSSPQCGQVQGEPYNFEPCSPESEVYGSEVPTEASLTFLEFLVDEERIPSTEKQASSSPGSINIPEQPSEALQQDTAEHSNTQDSTCQSLGTVDASLNTVLESSFVQPQDREDSMLTHADPVDDSARCAVLEERARNSGVSGTQDLPRGGFGSLIECEPDKLQALHQQLIPEAASQHEVPDSPVPTVLEGTQDSLRAGTVSLVQPEWPSDELTPRTNGLYPATEGSRQREKMPLNPLRAGVIVQFRHALVDQGLAGAYETTFDAGVGFNLPEEMQIDQKSASGIPEEEMTSIAEGLEALWKLHVTAADQRHETPSMGEDDCTKAAASDGVAAANETPSAGDGRGNSSVVEMTSQSDFDACEAPLIDDDTKDVEEEGSSMLPNLGHTNNAAEEACMRPVQAASCVVTEGQGGSPLDIGDPENSVTQANGMALDFTVMSHNPEGKGVPEDFTKEKIDALGAEIESCHIAVDKIPTGTRGMEACNAHMASIKGHIKALMHSYHELESEMRALGQ